MPLPALDIFEKMRGIFTPVTDIRRKILTEVARMIAEGQPATYVESLPYKIIDRDDPIYRCCVFRERAIVRERVRLAFGLDLQEFGAHAPIISDVQHAIVPDKVLQKPIVNVIKVGCERCPTESYWVTDACRGCMAHPCTSVCPKKAVSIIDGKSFIDQDLCIKCGKCAQVCPYNAIIFRERPCAIACGVDAISSDEEGYAHIDYEKCVSCGLCIVSCPFGAIAEKSEIVQVITALKSERSVVAEIAPSFVGQFGPLAKPEMILEGIRRVGFKDIKEVAYGADVDVLLEVEEVEKILELAENGGSKPKCAESEFVGTSCCPAWVKAARNHYPELSKNISESFTPMVETAKKIKKDDPDAMIVFIGPCIAKKMECFEPEVAAFVDFVITFEELAAMFQAFKIDVTKIKTDLTIDEASTAGRGFAVAKGVAGALVSQLKAKYGPDFDIPFTTADTLEDCLKMLRNVSKNRVDPCPVLIEGMACPMGCVGGPGTLAPLKRAAREVKKFSEKATAKVPSDYIDKSPSTQ